MNVAALKRDHNYEIVLFTTLPELAGLRRRYGPQHVRFRIEEGRLIGLVSSASPMSASLRDQHGTRSAFTRHQEWWDEFEGLQGERQYRGLPRLDLEEMLQNNTLSFYLEPHPSYLYVSPKDRI